MSDPMTPRIYVASLSDYNAGRLHGVFIDANQDANSIHQAIQTMLGRSREGIAEEWAIHDYEGFGPIHLSEYESIDTVAKLASGITEHGPAFAVWANLIDHSEWPEGLDGFEDSYAGHYPSERAFAEEQIEALGLDDWQETIPELLRDHVRIDYDSFVQDLSSMFVFIHQGDGVEVFWQ